MYLKLPTKPDIPIIWMLSVTYPNGISFQLGAYSSSKNARKNKDVKNMSWIQCSKDNESLVAPHGYKIQPFIVDQHIEDNHNITAIDIAVSK
jgi:hypothetical protein